MKEQEPVNKNEAKRMNPTMWRRIGASAASALVAASLAWGTYEHFDTSGDLISKKPTKLANPTNDDKVTVLTMNLEGKAYEHRYGIKEIVEDQNVDVAMFQEVERNDVDRLHKFFPSSYMNYVLASRWTHALQGGYGNLIMSELEQTDVEHKSLAGNSAGDKIKHWLKGTPQDIAGLDLSATKTVEASQEPRAIVSSITTFDSSYGPRKVEFANTHLGGDPAGNGPKVHDQQFDETLEVAEQNDQEGQGSIICGDLNSWREKLTFDFAEKGYVLSESDGPTTLSGKDIDLCAYKSNGVLGLATTETLNDVDDPRSDHYGVVVTWPIRP